jgi:hypothetical protein
MLAAATSFVCTIVVLVMLAVRGYADWSRSYAVTWYGLLIAATALGLVGLASTRRTAASGIALALSLPALFTSAGVFLLLVIITSGA